MPLVEIGAGIILVNVCGINKIAVEFVGRVVEGMAVGVGDTQGERTTGFAQRELQRIVVGVCDGLNALDASQTRKLAPKRIGIISASDSQVDRCLTSHGFVV